MTTDRTADAERAWLERGLSTAGVEDARAAHGRNVLSPLPQRSAREIFTDALGDPMLRILIVCAAISLGLGAVDGDWFDGIAITIAAMIVTGVGTLNELRAQRDYAVLDAIARVEHIRVRRDGAVVEIPTEDLVVGDLLEIHVGDVTPADSRIRATHGLSVSEAHITGEPETLKDVGDDLHGGTRILDGSARAEVVAVGDATTFGQLRLEVAERDKTTPLEERLDGLARRIGMLGTVAAGAILVVLLGSGLVRGDAPPAGFDAEFVKWVLDAVTIAVTIIVVAVPEGLPLAVTISLAYTTRQMVKDHALVRELSACETMGAATIVCSDKTGTLTTGQMSVIGFDPDDHGLLDPDRAGASPLLARALALNSTADLLVDDRGTTRAVGNVTDAALLVWLRSMGGDEQLLRDDHELLWRREFSARTKSMASICEAADGRELHVKGAPEVVLERCTSRWCATGPVALDDDERRRILDAVHEVAHHGHRTLALAWAPAGEYDPDDTDLCLLGVVVIADPLRPEVPAAVATAARAGVQLMIVTGDIGPTAQEIARQAGMVADDDHLLAGRELRELDDDEAHERLERTSVLYRALPDDKRRIVQLLQDRGHVVAVTGDGVNDAPALARADIGFAMGSGSSVAREAADVVIVDDNLATIVRAIRWGRSVFENIRKFLQFQLTVNLAAVTIAFLAALLGFGTPLTAVQLLWVNLLMDSLAALALAFEPPTDALLDQAPHGRREPLISPAMWSQVIVVGLVMIGVLLVVLLTDVVVSTSNDRYRATVLFNTFVFLQLWNELNCRSVRPDRSPFRGLRQSRSFLATVGAIVVIQVAIILFGGDVFSVERLTLHDWAVCVGLGAVVLPVAALVRLAGRRRSIRARTRSGSFV